MNVTEFIDRLQGARKSGDGWTAECPGHDDRHASLTVKEADDGRILVKCHAGAGCPSKTIVGKLGLTEADLFPTKPPRNGEQRRIVATYPYNDETGKLLFEVVRFEPKDFRQRKPDGKGGWLWKLGDTRRVLFRLPEITSAIQRGTFVFVCEGEKDCLTMAKHGLDATCNSGGAESKPDGTKWLASYDETLRGADVVIVADKDEPGRRHAQIVAGHLQPVAKSVRVLELPNVDGKRVKDAFDFFTAGGTAQQIGELVDSTPAWTPTAAPPAQSAAPDFAQVTSDVRGEILSILTDANCKGPARNRAVARLVVSALCQVGKLYYHAERRDFDSAMFFDSTAKRLLRIRADAFGAWLSDWLGINRADPLFKYAFAEVETAALSGAQTTAILPELFWASRPGAIYLSNGDGLAAKITAGSVALVDNGTDGVLFAAGRTLAPWRLTVPHDAFETCRLFREAHCTAAHGKDLLRLWLYSLPSNPKSKPPLCLPGPIGSGKTREAKGMAEFYGLPFVAQKVEEAKEDDFWPCCDGGGIFTLDNADTRCRWLADALANAATDGCSQRRKKYKDAETVVLRPRAWLCVTTANPTFAADSGLADRLLVVRMDRRGDDEASDEALTAEILANRDAGLSHVAQSLRTALADTAPTPKNLNHRHPDFAALAVRIGRALGREAEAVTALQAAEADKAIFCLENDPIASALLLYLRDARTFDGAAAELAPKLIAVDAYLGNDGWLSARRLGKRLIALWPHLKATLATAKCEKDRKGFYVFTLKTADSAEFAECEMPFSIKSS